MRKSANKSNATLNVISNPWYKYRMCLPAASTNTLSLYNDPHDLAVQRQDIISDLIMVILPLFLSRIWQTLHCQSWLTTQAEEWHQVSKSHNWPQALEKDTLLQKTSNVKQGRTCKGKVRGLHGITTPGAAVALKETPLSSGKLIDWTDNNVMIIFPDS